MSTLTINMDNKFKACMNALMQMQNRDNAIAKQEIQSLHTSETMNQER